MTEEVFNKLKIEINNERKLIELNKRRLNEASELEGNEMVRKYLELCGIETATNFIEIPNERDINLKIFNSFIANINPAWTNKIYIYSGLKTDSNKKYKKYFNIEQIEPVFIPIEYSQKFEKENIIIYAPIDEVKKAFLEKALETNQENAVVYVKNRFKTI